MSKIGHELVKVIKDKEFQGITKDLVETVIDSSLAEGVFKEIPLLSTIIGTFNTVSNIKDRLFLKKLLSFLYELKSVPEASIVEQIDKLENENKYRTKVGEKLLYIIDKCEDPDKASLVGTLFKVYLENKIDYDQFLSATNIIERTPLPDLLYFINADYKELDLEGGGSELVSYGLMEIRVSTPKIEVASTSRFDNVESHIPSHQEILQDQIKITNFNIKAYISWSGEDIRNHLKAGGTNIG
jgi:hypothetical protein